MCQGFDAGKALSAFTPFAGGDGGQAWDFLRQYLPGAGAGAGAGVMPQPNLSDPAKAMAGGFGGFVPNPRAFAPSGGGNAPIGGNGGKVVR